MPQNPHISDRRQHRVATFIALGVIVGVAAMLRFRGIGAQSLWLDEVLTWRTATASLSEFFETLATNENTPPLYFFIVNLWVRVLGDSDTALRLPSAIFGVGCIAAIFWLGRELWSDRVGLVAAIIIALSPYHIWYSQEARTYTLLFLLILCSSACLARLLRERARWAMLGYVIANTLAFYAHPFALFAIVAQNTFFILHWLSERNQRPALSLRNWLTLNGAVAVSFAPWLPNLLELKDTGIPWLTQNSTLHEAFLAYSGSNPLLALLGVLGLVGIGVAVWKRDMRVALAVLLLAFPILCPLVMSSAKQPAFHVRYGILSIIGLALLAGYVVAKLPAREFIAVMVTYVAMTLPLLRVAGYPTYPGVLIRVDMRSAAKTVAEEARAGDGLIVTEDWWMTIVFERYCQREDLVSATLNDLGQPGGVSRYWLMARPGAQTTGAFARVRASGYNAFDRGQFHEINLWKVLPVEQPGDFE